jgi:hypothetical protein
MVPIPAPTPSEFDEEFGHPLSSDTRMSFYTRSDTPDLASTLNGLGSAPVVGGLSGGGGRKGGAPKPMRAVNIIQHQDAGPSNNEEREEAVKTIELPPAYTMVRILRPRCSFDCFFFNNHQLYTQPWYSYFIYMSSFIISLVFHILYIYFLFFVAQ